MGEVLFDDVADLRGESESDWELPRVTVKLLLTSFLTDD